MRSCPVFLNNFDKIDADQSCFFYFEKMMPSCPDFFVIFEKNDVKLSCLC